jgi:septum formation protein
MQKLPSIHLTSASPRRREIFTNAGFEVTFSSPNVEESFDPALLPKEIPLMLAQKKLRAFTQSTNKDIVVAADTIVCIGNTVLNKPESEEEAKNMLDLLSGRTHTVYTGVCFKINNKEHSFVEETKVSFNILTQNFILAYIHDCKPFDKAGSYGIQDRMGLLGVSKIEGCYYNVMGFPISRFYQEIKAIL